MLIKLESLKYSWR